MTAKRSFPPRVLTDAAIIVLAALGWPLGSAAPRNNRPAAKFLNAPLSFESNQGQAASPVQFISRGPGYALFLAPGQIVLQLARQSPASADTLRMCLVGANSKAPAVGVARQTGVVSYFFGNDPKQWRTGIPTYGKVDYAEVYPGVDLVFYGNQRELEYDFVAAPGADPGRIAWRIDGARPSVDAKGDLTLSAPNGLATFRKPVVYQMLGDKKANVDGAFVVAGSQVGFRLGSYDRSKPLVIDPVLSYVTYLAGSSADYIGQSTGPLNNSSSQGIAIDAAGSAYVTGRTTSADFPTKSAYQGVHNKGSNPSVFVSKFSPDGSSLVYSTYLGGAGSDYADAIAVDSSGSAYITGNTNSDDFPVTSGAYQTLCSPSPSTPPGTVTKASCNTNNSAFVTKLNSAGTGLVYSTFLGGYGGAEGTGIAVDSLGRAYIAGNENAPCNLSYSFPACFPTTVGATIGTSSAQNGQWAFVAVLDPTGANLLYSTLFGDLNGLKSSSTATFGFVSATATAVDSNGYFYLIGDTKAGKLPTTLGAFQSSSAPLDTSNSNVTAFRGYVAKFNPLASASAGSLAACTYLGGKTGNTSDYLSGITVDSSGNIYVVGYTNSSDFPVTGGAFGAICAPGGATCDAGHVTKFNPSLTSAIWSTYIGGSRQDGGDDLYFTGPIQLDGKDNVYITGVAGTQFPLLDPVEPAGSGGAPGQMVIELDPTGSNLLFSTNIGSGRLDSMAAGGLAVNSAGVIYVAGNNIGADLITTPGAFETADPSPVPTCCYHGFVAKIVPTTAPQITVTGTGAAVYNAATLQAGGIAPNEFITLKGTGLGPATGVSGLTTQLGGSSVSIGGTAAFLTYAQDAQINLLVPFRVSGLASTVIQVTYNSQLGNAVTVPVVPSSPGIFTQSYGPGQTWMVNQDGTFNSASNPAPRGTYVAFWVTGQGLVNTTLGDGAQPTGPPFPSPLLPVSVSLGGSAVPASNLVFDGLIYSGEVQINVLIPANAPTGSAVPVVVTIGGASSRTDATIAIQ
jgi:uncharacterized protein (TIGR03437 family)